MSAPIKIGPVAGERVEGVKFGSDRRAYFLYLGRRICVGLGDRLTMECGFSPRRRSPHRRYVVGPEIFALGFEWRRR